MRLLITLFFLLSPLNITSADFVGPDKTPHYNSVKDVLDTPVDDVKIVLRGKITEKIAHERYKFSDDTGTIIVQIKDRLMKTITVKHTSTIEIYGEIEVKYSPLKTVEVEVDLVRLIKP